MYEIHGIAFSYNTTKVMYVAEQLGIDYTYEEMDLRAGANKTPEHLARHPFGKLPTLTHEGRHLFESGAICRYLAATEGSALYPTDIYERSVVDQWMDCFSVQPGRWLASLLFERAFRSRFGMGEPKEENIKEALGFLEQQLGAINKHLASSPYLAGETLTIADLFAYAYVETTRASELPLDQWPSLAAWFGRVGELESIGRARTKLGLG